MTLQQIGATRVVPRAGRGGENPDIGDRQVHAFGTGRRDDVGRSASW